MRFIPLVSIALTAGITGCGGKSSSSTDATAGDDASGDAVNAGTVQLTLTGRPTSAAMFTFLAAFQDGDGPWTLAPAPTGDTYALPIASGRYGVAWTCIATTGAVAGGTNQREVNLAYYTVAERPSLTMAIPSRCSDRDATVTLSGTIANRGAGQHQVVWGDRVATVTGAGAYTMSVVPGTHDLFVTQLANAIGANEAVAQVAVKRGLAVAANTTADVDFANAAAAQTFAITVATPANTNVTTTTTLYAGGTQATLDRDVGAPFVSHSLAAAQMQATDVYDQQIQVRAAGQVAVVSSATAAPAAQTYVAPAPLGGAIATVAAATPYPEIKTTWTAYANAVGYSWTATQSLAQGQCGAGALTTCQIVWSSSVSTAYLGTTASYQMPDLSALAGWSTGFNYIAGHVVTGTAEAVTSSAGAADFPPGIPAAGTKRAIVGSDWTVMP